jgi:predicted porin
MLHACNEKDEFLTRVMGLCSGVWFNTCNFPKTEVGSGKSRAPVQTLENLEMKKTLVAIAALAAFGAQAQSSVTITGTVDPHYQIAKTTTGSGVTRSANTMASGQVGTPNVTFAGTEDLGGGAKASFLYEMNFDTTDTDNTASTKAGQIFAGLSNSMGSIKLGAPNTPTLSTQVGRAGGFGSKIGGGRAGFSVGGTARTRHDDTVLLESANYGGFSVQFAHTARLTAATNTQGFATGAVANSINDIGVFYKNGPIDAGVSNFKQSAVVNQTTAFAGYTMGAAKVIVGMHSQNNLAATTEVAASGTTAATVGVAVGKIRGTNIAASYALTPTTTVFANVARANDKTTDNRDLSMTGVGVKYELSKRTSLNARMISEKRDNLAANSTILAKQTTTLLGVQHNF